MENKDPLAGRRKRHRAGETAQGARVLASQSEDPSFIPGTNKWWKAGDNSPQRCPLILHPSCGTHVPPPLLHAHTDGGNRQEKERKKKKRTAEID